MIKQEFIEYKGYTISHHTKMVVRKGGAPLFNTYHENIVYPSWVICGKGVIGEDKFRNIDKAKEQIDFLIKVYNGGF